MTLATSIRRALSAPAPAAVNYFRAAFSPAYPNGIRTAWKRLEYIRGMLAAGHEFNANTLAKLRGCSSKTIKRDVSFLRANGLPVHYDPIRNTFTL